MIIFYQYLSYSIIKKAEKEYNDVVTADRSYDNAQAGMADMRKEADELIADIMAESA